MRLLKPTWGFYALSAILLNVLGIVIYLNSAKACFPSIAQRQGMRIGSAVIASGFVAGIFCLVRLYLDLRKDKAKKTNIFTRNLRSKDWIMIATVVGVVISFLILLLSLFPSPCIL